VKEKAGFTLFELMVALALAGVLGGILAGVEIKTHRFSTWFTQMTDMRAQSRNAFETVQRELRQAALTSVSQLPAQSITYQVAADIDGNGTALDKNGAIELSPPRTICRDTEDKNGNGRKESELVLLADNQVRILAANVALDEDQNSNGTLDTGEDRNDNGKLDKGLLFERNGDSIIINVQTVKDDKGRGAMAEVQATVTPRN
jgi:prepilin-type N-terminal cleavage/methylation domain-containing protein